MKKQFKRQAITLLAAAVVVSGGSAYAADSNDRVQKIGQQPTLISAAIEYGITINGQGALGTGYMNKDGRQVMLPLREVSEALGFEIKWNAENMSAELTKPNTPIWTLVQTDQDHYSINKMYIRLGVAPVIKGDKLFVPVSFFEKVLHAQVSVEGTQVTISSQADEIKTMNSNGVITRVHDDGDRQFIQINGVETEGTILNIDEKTVIRNANEEVIGLKDLSLGMDIEVVHSLAMTMSLPGQTYAYEIKVQQQTEAGSHIGTSGTIQEVSVAEDGRTNIHVKGIGITEGSPDEVILGVLPETVIVDKEGKELKASELKKDAKVLVFYDAMLTRSLPPIGNAWKVVYLD